MIPSDIAKYSVLFLPVLVFLIFLFTSLLKRFLSERQGVAEWKEVMIKLGTYSFVSCRREVKEDFKDLKDERGDNGHRTSDNDFLIQLMDNFRYPEPEDKSKEEEDKGK